MIDKRLIKTVPDAMPHVTRNVILQITSLASNIVMMFSIGFFLGELFYSKINTQSFLTYLGIVLICIAIRVSFVYLASAQSYLASKSVKTILRGKIYDKVIKLGNKYNRKISTAELLQISVEGVEQLETYFGSYLPQFFYAMIAPLILFAVVSTLSFKIAIILFICVPLIPISIVAIQKFAKKLLAKYWGEYVGLADNFLENLQGLNTLKIYSSDEFKHKQMNKQAERFRIITMKVLSMQLNSIIVMDIIAYGGAALGVIFSALEYSAGNISFSSCFTIIMLCADFFLPLRILGSFFHIAMNGMSAAKKIFSLLDIEEASEKTKKIDTTHILLNKLSYSYDSEKEVLHNITIDIPQNSFISIVGKSGCGKSTIAGILSGINIDYIGSVTIGSSELSEISKHSLFEHVTLISANSYLFKGTVRDNLLMGDKGANEQKLWKVLDDVNLSDFVKEEDGLDTIVAERGSNLSGGQCQRLALARALLHDSSIYIFDEATSNIDVESENNIIKIMHKLAKTKTVILISHRLANVVNSDLIYVLDNGNLVEKGRHNDLLLTNGKYEQIWSSQQKLENHEEVSDHD